MVEAIHTGKLYTINQGVFATFFGGPLGGALLLAQNYKQLNAPQYAHLSVVLGLLATVALFPIALVLPERVSNVALPMAYTIAFRIMAERLQGKEVKSRMTAGVERHSWWRAVGISLSTLIVTLVVFVAGLLVVSLLSTSL